MKKIITFSAALILGVCAFAGVTNNIKMAKADPGINADDLKGLLNDYIDNEGQYTKKTTLFLTDAAKNETSYFHAGANALQRATYYDDDNGILLMGDYEGTFSKINSGYMNVAGGVQHFTYKGFASPNEEDLFTNITDNGWTASGQSVGEYYPTLTYLKTLINGAEWSYDGDYDAFVYYPAITMTDGNYDDNILRSFQYFVAPMMLQGSYFSWSSIRVTKASSFLSLRLLASSTDEEKSRIKGSTEVLVAEARIYKGLDLDAAPVAATLKGSFNEWGDGYEMEECTDIYVPEQYKYTLATTSANVEVKVNHRYGAADHWVGHEKLANNDYWLGGSDNISLVYAGTYSIYYKVLGNDNRSIYVARDAGLDKQYTFTGVGDWVFSADAVVFAWLEGNSYGSGEWVQVTGVAQSSTSFNLTFENSASKVLFVRCPSATTEPNWNTTGDAAGRIWNKTNDILLTAGTYSYSTNWVSYTPSN